MSNSVIVANEKSFMILDEEAYFKTIGLKMNATLFDINGPFIMDSQFEAEKRDTRRIRKRKRGVAVDGELDQDCRLVSSLHADIREKGRDVGYFVSVGHKDNNRAARDGAARVTARGSPQFGQNVTGLVPLSDGDFVQLSMNGGWYVNENEQNIQITVGDSDSFRACIIPSQSTFCCADVTQVSSYSKANDVVFDLVVMDPPWENRSAKRKGGYVLSDSIVSRISMDFLAPSGLCCVWITNRTGLRDELSQQLKLWELEEVAVWHWLKVTKEGEPVYDFHSSHKVPFETVVVASRSAAAEDYRTRLPNHFVVASVPMAVHSRKPPLYPVLEKFGIKFSKSCELFARSLHPNTVSIGYEPLFLQQEDVVGPIV